ncbi:MICAL-like protein 2 isoform X2 [Ochlerotatus camptorhynchus]
MANSTAFVGVPKREPCRKCGNPVFFAERISFEQKLYHRSCLKCARCGAQLTLGSFYETETDGEYCCETCPDEEIQIAERRRSMSAEAATESPVNGTRENIRTNRSSKLLERISFFESAPLSDEEKTSNMARRAKMTSFLKDSLEKSDKLDNVTEAEKNETVPLEESSDSEDEPDRDEPPPSPPATKPPPLILETDKLIIEPTTDIATTQASNTDNIEEECNGSQEVNNISTTERGAEESLEPPASSQRNSDTPDELNPITDVELITLNGTIIKDSECEHVNGESMINTGEEVIANTELPESKEQNDEQNAEVSQETSAEAEAQPVEVPEVHVICEEKNDSSLSKLEEVPKNEAIIISDTVTSEISIPDVEIHTEKQNDTFQSEEVYPSDLNPFGDDSDESSQLPSKPVPSARKVSTNPFGSDDEDESQPVNAKPPRPPPPKIKPLVPANPFGDDEDAEPENEIVPIIIKPSPRRTPVPTPRKQHNHTDSISSMETSLMSSQFGGSNVSLASSLDSTSASMTINRRKKPKAPDVPAAITKISTENLSTSQSTTPRRKRLAPAPPPSSTPKPNDTKSSSPNPTQRLITLDASLIGNDSDLNEPISRAASNDSVVYRRTIIPLKVDDDSLTLETTTTTSERQWEKMKDNKEAQNRNRQSQISPTSSQNDSYNNLISNKSQQGKWKRRKGPAPALPVPLPERKTIKMLPLKEIRQEMDIIETQQQGLEKQGVILEQMIRERCEGVGPEMDITGIQTNSKEVEDLIMQLFELVNEKNELFRRQAELMYLRRQHRLEQEQADLEYEIRLLMAQPERNKTDSDKEKEEALIARLVEIVQMRNEVVDCLEMDRLREAEEDMSIKQSIEERAASQQKHSKKDSDTEKSTSGDSFVKLSKKEKKKLKEAKKLVKSKKIDSEKDADETESSTKEKKKKKKFFSDFLHPK